MTGIIKISRKNDETRTRMGWNKLQNHKNNTFTIKLVNLEKTAKESNTGVESGQRYFTY